MVNDEWFVPTNERNAMSQFIVAAKRHKDIDAMLDALGAGVFDAKRNLILDGWGNPIRYYIEVDHSDDRLSDDMMRERRMPFFVSAGQDGQFGDIRAPMDSVEYKHTRTILSVMTGSESRRLAFTNGRQPLHPPVRLSTVVPSATRARNVQSG